MSVRRATDDLWITLEQCVYQGKRDTFTVPAGFMTDFASVPRATVWLIPRYGRYTHAAILHDWLIQAEISTGLISPRDVDGLLRRVLREVGVPPVQRWLMWTGVRWGALYNPARRSEWWRDAPAVLGISLLAAPVVAPPALLITAGLAVYGLAEALASVFHHEPVDMDTTRL